MYRCGQVLATAEGTEAMSVASAFSETLVESPAKATYQDVLDAPPHMVAEIIEGQLHLMTRPSNLHAQAWKVLTKKIDDPFDAGDDPGGWKILQEPELHLSEDVVVPDIAGWRAPWEEIEPLSHYITVVPDWVCEVLSPSTRRIDLGPKRAIFADHGVGHLWFLDPIARTLDAYALKDGDWASVGSASDQDMVCLPPFDAISFSLGDLWRW